MENANDFERFVLYRTEEALQMDSRGLEWNIQEKSELLQNQYINEILYRALNSTQPWNDFSFIDASGIKEFFYSNALACALVTFGYLSSENTTLEEIMCDPKKHEVAEKNKAIKEDAEEFRKKCQKLYEKRKVWQEEFKEKHNIKEWYIEIKEMEEKIKIEEKAVKTETDKKKIKADNNKLDEMKSYAEAIERKLANYAEIIKCPSTAVGTAVTGAMGAVGAGIGAAATAVEAAPIIGGVAANIATVAGTTAGATAVGTIATTGAVGAANAASGVNKRKVAEGIKSVSMMNYDAERKKLETTQDETNKRLAELGQLKLKAWGEGYPRFCEMYSKVKLPPNSNGEVALEGDLSITPEDLSEFRTLGIGIKEAMQTGATGYAVGMLAGFAAQSGATSMAIFASTGTAISSLSGAAATNATLAQLGGGALSAGGLGMAGGQAVLTGLKAAPLLMVEGILFNIKGNKVLENAKDIEYQTFKAVGKMQDIEIELKRLALLSKSVQDELQQLYDVYLRLVAQAEKTVERTTEYVNFTAAEKLNFQKTCLAIKLISVLSKQDLLDEAKEGEMNKVLDKETKETIQKVHQAAGDGKLLVA